VCTHRDQDGKLPLHWAAEHGLVDIAKLINQYTINDTIINDCDDVGWSPLHHAAANNHLPMVEYLVSAGANVNHVFVHGTKRYGPSSLHVAVTRGHLDIVKYLISVGIDLDYASSDDRIFFGDTPLSSAVINKQQQVMRFLIDMGCDLDKADNDGNTPLHKAAYLGHVGIIELLVTRGAKMTIKNNRHEDVKEIARRAGYLEANRYFAG
jgi:cytohesin